VKEVRYTGKFGQLGIFAFGSQPLIKPPAGYDADDVVRPTVELADWMVADVVLTYHGGAFTSRVERDVGREVPPRCPHIAKPPEASIESASPTARRAHQRNPAGIDLGMGREQFLGAVRIEGVGKEAERSLIRTD